MKSDERTISALSAQAHNAEADKRTLQKKLAASERRVQDLEKRLVDQQSASDEKIRNLTDQLSQEVAKVSSMMQQLVDYMMGKGSVTLSDTLRDSVVAGVREEVRREFQGVIDEKDARIAALEAQINHKDDNGESLETTIKKLEQRNQDLNRDLHGQKTEGKYNGRNNMTPADEADLNGEDVPESTFDVSDDEFSEIMDGINELRSNNKPSVKSKGRKPGQKVPQRPQPLKAQAREIVLEPDYVPEGATLCKDQEDRTYRIVHHSAWTEFICFVRPKYEKDHKYYQAKAPKHCMGKCKADASMLAWIIYEHLVKHVTLGEIENDLKSMGLNIAHSTLCHWLELAADRLEPLDEPLHNEIVTSGDFHGDESTLQLKDVKVGANENETDMHYYVRWIYDFIAPGSGLTQYWFYDQGRRTQEAVEEYVKGIVEKTYFHSDGAKMYEIFNAAGIIMRVACAVHVRRPFWKLKGTSEDAERIVYHFDTIFRMERKWNLEKGMTNEKRRQRRLEEVAPILH
jgi:transposase